MTKMHLNFGTRDLAASVAFYETLLQARPTKRYADYALFLTDEPGLELALEADSGATSGTSAHYGIVVETPADVDAAIARLRAAAIAIDVETDATCCYAVQNNVWATDPDGHRWETYVVLAETADRDDATAACCAADAEASGA